MKFKREPSPPLKKHQTKERGGETRRRSCLMLVAVFLAITFLASECAVLLPAK